MEREKERQRESKSSISTGRFSCQLRKRTADAAAASAKRALYQCTNACSGPEHVYKYIYVDCMRVKPNLDVYVVLMTRSTSLLCLYGCAMNASHFLHSLSVSAVCSHTYSLPPHISATNVFFVLFLFIFIFNFFM